MLQLQLALMSIAMDNTVHEGFPSSPAVEVGDNFDIEFFRPCSMKEEDASDAESGFYKTMAHDDEGDTEEEACSRLVEDVVFWNKCSSQVYRMTWPSSSDEEEEEDGVVEGVEGEEQEERSLKDNGDPREDDRAFWKACLAHGYP